MKFRAPLLASAAAAALVTGLALPAAADPLASEATNGTFALEGTGFFLSAQTATPVALVGETNNHIGTTVLTGNATATTVTDGRGGTASWTVSARSTTFTLGEDTDPAHPGPVVDFDGNATDSTDGSTSTSVKYTETTPTHGTGDVSTVADADEGTATEIKAVGTGGGGDVVKATEVHGINSATWIPTFTVTMPRESLAGMYVGTVTTSAL